ncbi:MAG: hypothetical protein WB566_07445, partial [Terriglobales bacterium]
MRRLVTGVNLPLVSYVLLCAIAVAQNAPSAPAVAPSKARTDAKAEKSTAKTVKAVAINMPGGMTHDQADAILNELRAIHQLLVAQGPRGDAPAPTNAPNNGPTITRPTIT